MAAYHIQGRGKSTVGYFLKMLIFPFLVPFYILKLYVNHIFEGNTVEHTEILAKFNKKAWFYFFIVTFAIISWLLYFVIELSINNGQIPFTTTNLFTNTLLVVAVVLTIIVHYLGIYFFYKVDTVHKIEKDKIEHIEPPKSKEKLILYFIIFSITPLDLYMMYKIARLMSKHLFTTDESFKRKIKKRGLDNVGKASRTTKG